MINPYDIPGSGGPAGPPPPARGGCLTLFLGGAMIMNPLVGLIYLFGGRALLGDGAWALPILVLLAVANTAFAVAAWNWRKWGVIGFCGSALIAIPVNLALGLGASQMLTGLIGPAILLYLVKDDWDRLR